jgi:uncharacterized protein YbjT (DUF2867 family)
MKIVIVDGNGLIGTRLGKLVRDQGHQVTAASPSFGVDAVTSEGLIEALARADAVTASIARAHSAHQPSS